jgi:DNA-directed RNA polymerase subunit RPC12/RpoP
VKRSKSPLDSDKLAEFFAETETKTPVSESPSSESASISYVCPRCGNKISRRKEPCPHCGYHGYVPMSPKETLKIRMILFFVLLAVAIIVYILTQNN